MKQILGLDLLRAILLYLSPILTCFPNHVQNTSLDLWTCACEALVPKTLGSSPIVKTRSTQGGYQTNLVSGLAREGPRYKPALAASSHVNPIDVYYWVSYSVIDTGN